MLVKLTRLTITDRFFSSRQLHQEQTEKLHREIENWKDKCNKAQIDVTEAEIRLLLFIIQLSYFLIQYPPINRITLGQHK